MKVTKQISVSKTEKQWGIIQTKIDESGKKTLTAYVRCEILKIKKVIPEQNYYQQNDKITIVEKRPCLPNHLYDQLIPLAVKMEMSVSNLVENFIINPLLTPDEIKPL